MCNNFSSKYSLSEYSSTYMCKQQFIFMQLLTYKELNIFFTEIHSLVVYFFYNVRRGVAISSSDLYLEALTCTVKETFLCDFLKILNQL